MRRPDPHKAFTRRIETLGRNPRVAATMWREYVATARLYARLPGGSGRAVWLLAGAAHCRAIMQGKKQAAALFNVAEG